MPVSKRQYRKSKLKGGSKRKSKLKGGSKRKSKLLKKKQYRKLKLSKKKQYRKLKLKGGSKRKSKLLKGGSSPSDVIYAELDLFKQQIDDNDNFSIIRISNDAPDPDDPKNAIVYTTIEHSGTTGASEVQNVSAVPNVQAVGEVFANVTNPPSQESNDIFTYTPFPKEIKPLISRLITMYIGKRDETVFQNGLFLIRKRDPPSELPNEKLAISIFYNKKIVHVIIEESSQGFIIPAATDPKYFGTLKELINHYGAESLVVKSISLNTKLKFFISGRGEYDQTTKLVTMISKYNEMKEDLVQQIKKFNLEGEGVERKGSNVLTQGTKIMAYDEHEQILDDLRDINSTDNSKLDFIIFKMGKIVVKLNLTKEIVRNHSTEREEGTSNGDYYDHEFDAYRVYFSVNNNTYYIDIVNIDLNLEEMKTKYDVRWRNGHVGYKINKAGNKIITDKGYSDILSLISNIKIDIDCTFVKDKDTGTYATTEKMPSITNTDGQSFEFNFRNQFTKA